MKENAILEWLVAPPVQAGVPVLAAADAAAVDIDVNSVFLCKGWTNLTF